MHTYVYLHKHIQTQVLCFVLYLTGRPYIRFLWRIILTTLQIMSEPNKFFNPIAEALNSYCSTNAVNCCHSVGVSSTGYVHLNVLPDLLCKRDHRLFRTTFLRSSNLICELIASQSSSS